MAYINYARVQASRGVGRSSAVQVITKDINDIPWAKLFEEYRDAANEWEDTALAAHEGEHQRKYEYMLKGKEADYRDINPEGGAYEGNLADEFPMDPIDELPGKAKGRRRAGQKALVAAIENLRLGDWSENILPQLITYFGNMPIDKNDNGLISGKKFLSNLKTNKDKGMYAVLMLDSRSCFLGTQYKLPSRTYSALVPLILYGQRLIKGIAYTTWDPEEIHYVINNDLADAMLFTAEDWPTNEELLDGRTQGLTFASGKDLGKVRNPVTTYRLYATTNTCYQGIPSCAQVMLAQIWVAHPDNRTKYMVLDPRQWDRVPPALVSQNVLQQEAKSINTPDNSPNIDWL